MVLNPGSSSATVSDRNRKRRRGRPPSASSQWRGGGERAPGCCSGGSDCAVCDCDHSDARCAGVSSQSQKDDAMTNSRTYEGWWDLSRLDERNEQPLHAAIVAVVVVWATALLLALV